MATSSKNLMNEYSIEFSNKLIDLAISADAEELSSIRTTTEEFGTPDGHQRRTTTSTKKSIPGPASSGTTDPNLITVFSSPCSDYFSTSRRSNGDDELPEYVKLMMEQDPGLQQRVKSGLLTFSHVKTPNGSTGHDDDEEDGDEDFLNGNDNEYSRSFAPMGKVKDWETFPFAKRLLELAQVSLAGSPDLTFNGINAAVKPKGTVALAPVAKVTTSKSKGVFKQPVSPRGVRQKSQQSRLSPTVDDIQFVKGKRTKKTGRKRPPLPTVEVGTPTQNQEDDDCFHFDPLKFLEVSLQEGKPPAPPEDSARRKYKCGFCEKKFCWSTDLKRHTLIHTGERPFKCPSCAATFTRKFLMQKHTKKAHVPSIHLTTVEPPDPNGPPTQTGSNEEANDEEDYWNSCLSFSSNTPPPELKAEDSSFDYLELDEGQSDDMEFIQEEPLGPTSRNVTYLDF